MIFQPFTKLPLRPACVLAACAALVSCSGYGRASLNKAPLVVNVSSYDPKERQRSGDGFSEGNVSSLRHNGAQGLIARCGKGREIDSKCASFLSAADRQGLKLGTYHFVRASSDATSQASLYVSRLRQIAAQNGLRGRNILLVGDFDQASSPSDIVAFIDRVETLTGVIPVIYLENSSALRSRLSSATPAQKKRIRQAPYWLALYSHDNGFTTPKDLTKSYGIWNEWALWQYGGVEWDGRRGRSVSKHYHYASWRSPEYVGTMDRPLEHNAFNGSQAAFERFWQEHSWRMP